MLNHSVQTGISQTPSQDSESAFSGFLDLVKAKAGKGGIPPWEEISKPLPPGPVPYSGPPSTRGRDPEEAQNEVMSPDVYDCHKCYNRGYLIMKTATGYDARECSCQPIRRSLYRLRKQGLESMAIDHTFSTWKTPEKWHETVLAMAKRYAEHPEGWFYIGGSVGAGKTHICTAITVALIYAGHDVRYTPWLDMADRAKALVNDPAAFGEVVAPLVSCRVLYLDDLFKGDKERSKPTPADIRLAYKILDARYRDKRKLTILSSEYTLQELTTLDEAIGSRIQERCGQNAIPLIKRPNWRLRHAP